MLSAETEEIADLNFDPKHGWFSWIGFMSNLGLMVVTDPTMVLPGVGIGGRSAQTSKTLAAVGKDLDDYVKAGGRAAVIIKNTFLSKV